MSILRKKYDLSFGIKIILTTVFSLLIVFSVSDKVYAVEPTDSTSVVYGTVYGTGNAGLRLRSSIDTSSTANVIDKMSDDTRVIIISEKIEKDVLWYQVKYKSKTGWASAEYIRKDVSSGGSTRSNTTPVMPPTLSQSEREKIIWNYFKGKGLNDYAIAGIMGNLYAESNLNPKNLQGSYEKLLGFTDDSYTRAVDNGSYKNFTTDSAGYGLAQWTDRWRKPALLNYAKSKGKSIGDINMQLDFLWSELVGYSTIMQTMEKATSVKEVSDIFMVKFERPYDQSDAAKIKRAGYGQRYYNLYKSNNVNNDIPVKDIQSRLKELGYLNTGEYKEGVNDNATVLAVKVFQAYNGITTDGIVGRITKPKLFSSTAKSFSVIRMNEKGAHVLGVQLILKNKGLLYVNPDGWWGNKSKKATNLYYYFNGKMAKSGDAFSLDDLKELINGRTYSSNEVISLGNKSLEVKSIQEILNKNGYIKAEDLTGVFDKNTVSAIKLIQITYNIFSDGMVGGKTRPVIIDSIGSYKDISFNEKSYRVLAIQEKLKEKGLLNVRPDGWWGNKSAAALKLFRYFVGDESTSNVPNISDLKALYDDDKIYSFSKVIGINSNSPEVKAIQKILNDNGYLSKEDITGVFDQNTSLAIKILQINNNIYPDGLVGAKTRYILLYNIKPFKPVTFMENSYRVGWVQKKLEDKGLFFLKQDATFGYNTANALIMMYKLKNIDKDSFGQIDIEAFKLLFDDSFEGAMNIKPTSKLGESNDEILKAKIKIKAIGFNKNIVINNVFDDEFYRIIKEFQESMNMGADGIMGPKTVKALNSYNKSFGLKRGIDVSYHNGVIDWKKVKQGGVDFAIIKVGGRGYGTGQLYADKQFEANIKGALAAGIKVGVYFYTAAMNEKEAIEEANYTIQKIKEYDITLPVAYDSENYYIEDARDKNISTKQRTDNTIAFLETVRKAGYEPMLYANKDSLNNEKYFDTSRLVDKYLVWFAQYYLASNNKQYSTYDQYLADNRKHSYTYEDKSGPIHMVQFTSEGSVAGIQTAVDMIISYINFNV